jgi:hypothetical protein
MLPFWAARIGDLSLGDLGKADCAACHHVALLTPGVLSKLGLSPTAKVLDVALRFRCRRCRAKGRAVVSIKWRAPSAQGMIGGLPTSPTPMTNGKDGPLPPLV